MRSKKSRNPLVIGIVGWAGSGKDTVAAYIKHKYNAEEFRFSYLMVKTLEVFGIEVSRENLAWLTNVLKKKFGGNILTKAMKRTIEEMAKKPIVVINGLRLPPDYPFFRSFKRNVLVFLDPPARVRWQRVCKRKEKADDCVTFKEFLRLTSGENERHIGEIGRKADFTIVNKGSKAKLHKEIDKIMEQIL